MDTKQEANSDRLRTVAIIPAAGAGVRMGGDRVKQFVDLEGRPLIAMTLKKFQESAAIDSIIVVVPSDEVNYCQRDIVERYGLTKVEKVIAGGLRRQDSVRLGLEASKGDYGLVLIHDGVRPLISPKLIDRAVAAGREHRAVITGIPPQETVKEIDTNSRVVKTHDRRRMWLVQTPQVFRYEDILAAHRKAIREDWGEATDDALLVERMGIPVTIMEGSRDNIKVTTEHDLELVRFLLEKRKGEPL
jgi:2-C-methyl-D-erythritol 4-phosphate cytidylyltransferase